MSNGLKAGIIVLAVALLFVFIVWSLIKFPIVGKIFIGALITALVSMPFALLYFELKNEFDRKSRSR